MHQIATGLWQLSGVPRNMINVYLMEDVLIDAGTRWAAGRILRQLRGRKLSMVALTHCHPDHQHQERGDTDDEGTKLDRVIKRQAPPFPVRHR